MGRAANVFYNDRLAGVLLEAEAGYRFTYDGDYLAGGAPIGFHFPLQEDPFEFDEFPSFFENLTSEGWLRTVQSQSQKIDEDDRFGLLLHNGADLVGAVTVIAIEENG